jgi:Tfp pilus assembly protein PilF
VIALNGLGEALLAEGHRDAREPHATALDLASQTDNGYEQARAHYGLARVYQSAGQPGQARHHWQHALAEFTRLGTPEADQVRAELATADGHRDREL